MIVKHNQLNYNVERFRGIKGFGDLNAQGRNKQVKTWGPLQGIMFICTTERWKINILYSISHTCIIYTLPPIGWQVDICSTFIRTVIIGKYVYIVQTCEVRLNEQQSLEHTCTQYKNLQYVFSYTQQDYVYYLYTYSDHWRDTAGTSLSILECVRLLRRMARLT